MSLFDRDFDDDIEIDAHIDQLRLEIDRIKYYDRKPTPEEVATALENMIDFLEELKRDVYRPEIIENEEANVRDVGFKHAKILVIHKVLENKELKTRDEMIAAVDKLEVE